MNDFKETNHTLSAFGSNFHELIDIWGSDELAKNMADSMKAEIEKAILQEIYGAANTTPKFKYKHEKEAWRDMIQSNPKIDYQQDWVYAISI